MQIADTRRRTGAATDATAEFLSTWGAFPYSAYLLRPDRRIIAANDVAAARGAGPLRRCFEVAGRETVCPHCHADIALRTGQALQWQGLSRGKYYTGLWIPRTDGGQVTDQAADCGRDPALYVHTAIDITGVLRPELLKA